MKVVRLVKYGMYGYGIINEDGTKFMGPWNTKWAATMNMKMIEQNGQCFGTWIPIK